MKRKCIILGLLCALFACSFGVGAEETFENVKINYKRSDGTVSISGGVPAAGADAQSAQLIVVRPGTDMEKLSNGEISFINCGIHADETPLEEKQFAFPTFTMPAGLAPGDYIVRIASDGLVYEDVIYFATTAQTVELLNSAQDAAVVADCIRKYNDVYGLSLGSGSVWEQLPSEGKTYVYESLLDSGFAGAEEVRREFDIRTLLYQIKTGPWGVLETIVEENSELFSLDKSSFNDLSGTQKDNVYKALVGQLYTDAEDFSDAFDDAVADAETDGKTNNRGSGSGGGGGDRNVSMQIGLPEDVTPDNEGENTGDELPFRDLDGYDWAKGSIRLLYQKGIVNGRTDSEFAPDALITRAEAVKMIVLTLGGVDENAESSFSDIGTDMWSYPYLATAEQKGIISGYGNGMSGAEDYVTREDLAVMVLRAANLSGKGYEAGGSLEFGDAAAISPYAAEAVQKLCSAGVISGADNNLFLPKNNATRAQSAKILAALLVS